MRSQLQMQVAGLVDHTLAKLEDAIVRKVLRIMMACEANLSLLYTRHSAGSAE